MERTNRCILIDSDVISHFVAGGRLELLPGVFPNIQIILLDKVYEEIKKRASIKQLVDEMLHSKSFLFRNFPEDDESIVREYLHIKRWLFKGDGESACMAVAKSTMDIIASSNLKDIHHYCVMHGIDYLTTMDFLCAALDKGMLTIEQCNQFITLVMSKGSKLPVLEMCSYQCRDLAFVE